jgi:hypothetical protein
MAKPSPRFNSGLFFDKQEVSHAIGVEVVATQTVDVSCSYLAKGNRYEYTNADPPARVD